MTVAVPRSLIALLLLSASIAGCIDDHITDAVNVTNESSHVLRFEIDLDSGQPFLLPPTAAPGQTIRLLDGSQLSDYGGMTRERCTVGELRAFNPDGTIAARWGPGVCATTTLIVP